MRLRLIQAWPRILGALILLGAAGCTALREIPPAQYASEPERRNVRLYTRDGLVYEFDFVKVSEDTLVGYRGRNVTGTFEDYVAVRIPLQDVGRLSSRGVDWYRSGVVGGGMLAAVLVASMRAGSRDDGEPTSGAASRGSLDLSATRGASRYRRPRPRAHPRSSPGYRTPSVRGP